MALFAMARVIALGLLVSVGACTGRPDGVEPVRGFEIGRYLGTWYEIMRLDHSFERGLGNVTTTYTRRDDGAVDVLNKGFNRTDCRWREVRGRAVLQGEPAVASLSVTFFWPFAGGYHVFALDHDGYRWAMIAGGTREYLWILARDPVMPTATRADLIARARALGFAVDQLIDVDQSAAGDPVPRRAS